MRRASNSNRSNRFDIPVLTVSDPIPVKWQRNRVCQDPTVITDLNHGVESWVDGRRLVAQLHLIRWREPEKPERLHTRDSGPSVIPAASIHALDVSHRIRRDRRNRGGSSHRLSAREGLNSRAADCEVGSRINRRSVDEGRRASPFSLGCLL